MKSRHHRRYPCLAVGIVLLCTVLSRTAVSAQGKSDIVITIPSNFHATRFTSTEAGIVVSVRLNDAVSCNFLLDTGGYTSITEKIASQLGYHLTPEKELSVTAACKGGGTLKQLAIEGLEMTDVPVQLIHSRILETWNAAHPSQKIEGVLGIDALNRYAVGIDFPSHTLGWWEGGKVTSEDVRFFAGILRYPENVAGAMLMLAPGQSMRLSGKTLTNKKLHSPTAFQVPLVSAPDLDQVFVPVRLDGKQTEMVLGTSTNFVCVPDTTTKGLHPLFRRSANVASQSASAQSSVAIFSHLTLGELSFDLPLIGIIPTSLEAGLQNSPAVLGMNLFTDCRILMDFPRKLLYLQPYADYNGLLQRQLKQAGIGIQPVANNQMALYTFPHSPGESAGIRSGDILLAIDGLPAAAVYSDPNTFANHKTLALRVKRRNVKQPLVFTIPTASLRKMTAIGDAAPNTVLQTMIATTLQDLNGVNPFTLRYNYTTDDGITVHIDAAAREIHGKNQIPLDFARIIEVPASRQILEELNALLTACRKVRGEGYIHVRIEKRGKILSNRTSRFVQN